MTTPTKITVWWAGSTAFLNKERLQSEKHTWTNFETDVSELLQWTAEGKAHCCPLTLNSTNSPAFPGKADPSLGPFMRKTNGKSERLNENALATNLIPIDLDGDTTLEQLLATQFAQNRVYAVTASARNLRVEVDGELQWRLRVFVVAPETIPLFFNDSEFSDPAWLVKEVRKSLISELCEDLGIESIVDESGKDLARIWYGNSGPSHPIGDGDTRPAAEQIIKVLGNVLPNNYVEDIRLDKEDDHISDDDEKDYGDIPVGTPAQLRTAHYILSNGILSADRAADYHEWIRLLHAVKKLDPSGDTLIDAFLKFSEQSSVHEPTVDDILQRMDMLPPADEIFVGITALRDAATEDTPGWEQRCPLYGHRTVSVEGAGFVGVAMDGPMFVHLRKMYEAAGRTPPELQQTPTHLQQQSTQRQPAINKRRSRSSNTLSLLQRQTQQFKKLRQVDNSVPASLTADEFNGYDEQVTPVSKPDADF